MKFLPQEVKARRAGVRIWIGDPNQDLREALRASLGDSGFSSVVSYAEFLPLKNALSSDSPDVLIVSNSVDPQIVSMLKDIRYGRLTPNPFILIILMVDDDDEDTLRPGVNAGVDSIVIKPVSGQQILERLANLASNRRPFIVTNDYIGPERRSDPDRKSNIRQIEVLNTVQKALNGQKMAFPEIKAAAAEIQEDLKFARLDSHAFRVGFLCNVIVTAYREDKINEQLKGHMKGIEMTVQEGAKLAKELKAVKMADILFALKEEMPALVDRAQNLDKDDLALLRKMSRAVVDTLSGKHDNAAYEAALNDALTAYKGRGQGGAEKTSSVA